MVTRIVQGTIGQPTLPLGDEPGLSDMATGLEPHATGGILGLDHGLITDVAPELLRSHVLVDAVELEQDVGELHSSLPLLAVHWHRLAKPLLPSSSRKTKRTERSPRPRRGETLPTHPSCCSLSSVLLLVVAERRPVRINVGDELLRHYPGPPRVNDEADD